MRPVWCPPAAARERHGPTADEGGQSARRAHGPETFATETAARRGIVCQRGSGGSAERGDGCLDGSRARIASLWSVKGCGFESCATNGRYPRSRLARVRSGQDRNS